MGGGAGSHGRSPFAALEPSVSLLVEAVSEYGIFLLDADGYVRTWNAGAQRIKGYDAEQIVGRHFSVFYPPEDVEADKPARQLATARNVGQCRDEGWRVRKDGTRFWASVLITALFDTDGELVGYGKVTKDETERRDLEAQARDLDRMSDRERIALGLCDTVVHRIFDASLMIQGAMRLVKDREAAHRIGEALDHLDETLKQIRSIVLDLGSDDD